MAAMSEDDMPVMTSRLPVPPEDSSFWPEIDPPEGKDGIFSTPWTQAIKDILNFLDLEEPYSVDADEDGNQLAEFLIAHSELSVKINEKKDDLKRESDVDVKVTYFKNWAGTRRGLVLYARPTYIREVKKLVKACEKLQIKVGCGGSYHTWAPLYPDPSTTDQFSLLISNRDLLLEFQWDRLFSRRIDYEKEKQEVTISAGVTTGELLKLFMKEKVCFKTDVIAQNFTYGGVLATGSHGTGKDQPIMSDFIESIKLVGPGGEVRTFPKDFDDVQLPDHVTRADAMNALKVHLGVFGVVVEITLKLQQMKSAEVRHFYPQMGELFYGPNPTIKSVVNKHWSVQLLWFPFNSLNLVGGLVQGLPFTNVWQPKTDEVWLHTVDLVDTYTETNKWDQLQVKVQDTVQSVFAGELGSPLISRYPFLVPAYLAAGFKTIKAANPPGSPKLEELPYAIHFRYGLKYATVYDMEFAFPVSIDRPDGFKTFLDAIDIVVTESEEAAKPGFIFSKKEFPLTSALDIRFIKKSECLLCPATARIGDTSTHTAYIEILSFVGTQNYKEFFTKIGRAWMKLGGAPHWAKQWTFLEDKKEEDDIYHHLRTYYGENMIKFKQVLEALNGDKKDTFINKTMKKLLFEE